MSREIHQHTHAVMARPKRKFTDEQKLEILQQAQRSGVTAVLRDHALSYSVFARWKEKIHEKR